MNKLDQYSYQCGVMDAFNEVVRAGVKRLALAHPCDTIEQRDSYLPYAKQLCEKYGTYLYIENDSLLTDLFPFSMNKNKYNIVFAKDPKDLDIYVELHVRKKELINKGLYHGEARKQIAVEFGKLLSYSDEAIEKFIETNPEKEVF